MGHCWGEHVGELELRLDAAEEAGLFAAAVGAIGELLGSDERAGAREWMEVSAEGAERAVLLAAWVEELVFVAEHDGIVPVTAEEMVLESGRIGARIGGYRGDPPHLVKAVTYHRLTFERRDGGWRAVLLLDV